MEENNIVSIVDSNFTSCSAGEGGGALSLILGDSLASTSRPSNSNPTLLNVSKTLFHNNSSPTGGSAVGLVSNTRIDQFTFIASFQDWLVVDLIVAFELCCFAFLLSCSALSFFRSIFGCQN